MTEIPVPPRAGSFLSLGPGIVGGATGFHRISFTDWGEAKGRKATVCVHGLTRTGRDFDVLAGTLSVAGRVVCPDMPGRGASDWLSDPAAYTYPTYLADMATLMAHVGAERVDWVGTSMGGLIGMMLSAAPNTPIRKLVINDIGPFLPKEALVRISHYVGAAPDFPDMGAVEAYLRDVHAPFGRLTDAEWRHMAVTSAVADGSGGYRLHYDPRIADAFTSGPIEDIDLWAIWDRIEIPVLVLRGAESDLLTADTAAEMARRGPRADIVTVEGCGHAPALMDPAQVAAVADWLGVSRP